MKMRSKVGAGLAVGAAALVAGSIAWAAVPDSNGVIHACYNKTNGKVRVTDAQNPKLTACLASTELPLDWNRQGPAGLQGATGAQGPKGDAGPQGPAGPEELVSGFVNADATQQKQTGAYTVSLAHTGGYSVYQLTFPQSSFGEIPVCMIMPLGSSRVEGIVEGGSPWYATVYLSQDAIFNFVCVSSS